MEVGSRDDTHTHTHMSYTTWFKKHNLYLGREDYAIIMLQNSELFSTKVWEFQTWKLNKLYFSERRSLSFGILSRKSILHEVLSNMMQVKTICISLHLLTLWSTFFIECNSFLCAFRSKRKNCLPPHPQKFINI